MIHSIACRGWVRAGPRAAYPSGHYGSPRLTGRGAGRGARQPADRAPRQDIPIRRCERGRDPIRPLGIARVPEMEGASSCCYRLCCIWPLSFGALYIGGHVTD
jgi:hypothetical protein